MPKEYAESRIKEILKSVDGHPGKARRKLMEEAVKDHRLLLAMTQGHLTGIASLWVDRVINRLEREPAPVPEKPKPLDMDVASFGQEILSAMQSGNAVTFANEGSAPRIGKKQASQAHINAIHQIAKNSGKKKS